MKEEHQLLFVRYAEAIRLQDNLSRILISVKTPDLPVEFPHKIPGIRGNAPNYPRTGFIASTVFER